MPRFENYEACKRQVNELMSEGKRDEAITTLNEYLTTNDTCREAYYYKLSILKQKGNYENIDVHTQCIEVYDQLINIDLTNYNAYLAKSTFLLNKGKITKKL